MELFLGILLGLFVLVVLVVLHELGHAIVARRNGVVVEEFGIGFPPRAWSRQLKNGILFSLNWLPLGGFVKLKGEHNAATGKGTYGAASFWVKTKILLAGVLINWLTAAALLGLISLWGLPKIFPNQVTLPFDSYVTRSPLTVAVVTKGSPAESAGIKANDEILSIEGDEIATARVLSAQTERLAGKEVVVRYKRGGEERSTVAKLNSKEQAKSGGYLGVSSGQRETIRATWSAPVLGLVTAGQVTGEIFSGLGGILAKTVTGFVGQFSPDEAARLAAKKDLTAVGGSVAGPIGILGVIFPSVVDAGITQILLLTAIISLTLAVMNVLPLPALDGGRWFTMAIFRLLRQDLTKEREEKIQVIGFLLLMGLVILVTWNDIARLF